MVRVVLLTLSIENDSRYSGNVLKVKTSLKSITTIIMDLLKVVRIFCMDHWSAFSATIDKLVVQKTKSCCGLSLSFPICHALCLGRYHP